MNRAIERGLDAAIVRSPLQLAFRWRSGTQLAVLAYHGIDDPDQFDRHLRWLRDRCNVISPAEFMTAVAGEGSLPRHAVLITFDDGRASVFEHGLPSLLRYGMSAIVFVVAGLVDTDAPYWWEEVEWLVDAGATTRRVSASASSRAVVDALKELPNDERLGAIEELRASSSVPPLRTRQLSSSELAEMSRSGIAIGSHTFTHPCLDRCSADEVDVEISTAHARLEEIVGKAPMLFAFPNGNVHPSASEVLGRLGYVASFVFDHRLAAWPASNPFCLSRLRVNSHTSLDRLQAIKSGLHPALHRLRGGR